MRAGHHSDRCCNYRTEGRRPEVTSAPSPVIYLFQGQNL
nr:MAG TPA: hypothetical protein [Caudoviricetes sp.]